MNTDETINKEELTLQNTPKAVNYLINEIAEMRVLLDFLYDEADKLGCDVMSEADKDLISREWGSKS